MRFVPWILAVAAACSDTKSTPKDAAPGDGAGDAAPIDAPTCAPPPLAACASPRSGTNVVFREITPALADAALLVTAPKNDPRLFVVQRDGLIHVYENEVRRSTPFLDVRDSIAAGDERGLLGLAFHPQYGCNGQFFIFYTTLTSNVVARCTVSTADPNVANPTCAPVLTIPDWAPNHNGGMIEFGPDGLLYIGTGDGGGAGDNHRNGQSLVDGSPLPESVALLGKMLRIDVDRRDPGKEYAIPPTNPFASGGGAPEIYLIGLRNPWRWSFDKATGDLWIGDVGQGMNEELNVLRPGEQAGKNLGWSMYEANACCMTQADRCVQQGTQLACTTTNVVFPFGIYAHATWISIVTGETYRGTCYPDLVGWHVYSDYSSQTAGLHRARLTPSGFETQQVPVAAIPSWITSIHADARGELHVTTVNGQLYRLEVAP